MFVRVKAAGPYRYLQVVANQRDGRRTRQRVLGTLGRVDQLHTSGATDALLRSLARFADRVRVIDAYQAGHLEAGALRQLGPDLVFGRLWQSVSLQTIVTRLLGDRAFGFPVERAVYLSVLHRLRVGLRPGRRPLAAGPAHPRRGAAPVAPPVPGDALAGRAAGGHRRGAVRPAAGPVHGPHPGVLRHDQSVL